VEEIKDLEKDEIDKKDVEAIETIEEIVKEHIFELETVREKSDKIATVEVDTGKEIKDDILEKKFENDHKNGEETVEESTEGVEELTVKNDIVELDTVQEVSQEKEEKTIVERKDEEQEKNKEVAEKESKKRYCSY